MLYGAMKNMKKISENQVFCLALNSAVAAASPKVWPEELGGLGDLRKKFEAITASTEDERLQKMNEVCRTTHTYSILLLLTVYIYTDLPSVQWERCQVSWVASCL